MKWESVALAQGACEVRVVAAFLSAGGRHLKRDVPKLVAEVDDEHPDVRVHLVPGALGDDDAVVQALAAAALRRGGQILPQAEDG